MILTNIAALSFVIIWSTGFIVARQIADDTDPNLFLSVRFFFVTVLFALYCKWSRAQWPDSNNALRLLGIGALLSGFYLGFGFWAVGQGLQPGVMALIGTLQPPLTAILAWRFLKEEPSRWTFAGLFIGMIGVALAVSPTLHGDTASGIKALPLTVLSAAVVSILSITAGTLLQRSSVSTVDIAPACALQNVGGFLVVAMLAILLGESRFSIDTKAIAALVYTIVVLSIGGFTLFIWLVRTGGATKSSSLLFLAPPLASIMAWYLYDDLLTPIQIMGFIITLAGVWLARK